MVETKIMKVFYDANCLPYKDKERQVHYPIVGNSFTGASGTTEIKFYVDQIGDLDLTWVVNAKLPNGKTGSKVLSSSGNDSDGAFVRLYLDSWYTQVKGDLYISLQGYQGGINYTYDGDLDLYSISGTPIIQATGVIKINIAFSSPFNGVAELSGEDYQSLLALIADSNTKGFTVVDDIYEEDLSNYGVGHLFYDKESAEVYAKTNTSPYFTLYYGFLKDYFPYIDITGDAGLNNTIRNMCSRISSYGVNAAIVKLKSAGVNRTFLMKAYTTDGSNAYADVIAYELTSSPTFYYAPHVVSSIAIENVFEVSTYKVDLASQNWVRQNFYTKTESDNKYVQLTGTQTITGKKTFNNIGLWDGEFGDGEFTFETNQDYLNFEDRYGNTINIDRDVLTIGFNTAFDGIVNFEEDVYANANFQVEGYSTFRDRVEIEGSLYVDYDITTDGEIYTHSIYPQGNMQDDIGDSTHRYRRIYTAFIYFTPDVYLYCDGGDELHFIDENTYEHTIATTDYVEGVVSTLKANSFQVVQSLPVTGQEGIIYLIETSSNVYEQYIWEGSDYIDLGTTQIDLSGYVPTSRTIAGLALTNNISASELTGALVFATNSDIDALFE